MAQTLLVLVTLITATTQNIKIRSVNKNNLDRRKKMEHWGKDGVQSAGFWARYLLWNKTTIKGSVDDIHKMFKNLNVKIK